MRPYTIKAQVTCFQYTATEQISPFLKKETEDHKYTEMLKQGQTPLRQCQILKLHVQFPRLLVGSSELEQFGEDLLLLSYHLQCKCLFSWTSSTWCLQLSLIQVQCSRYIQHPTVSDSTHELPSVSLLGI